MTENLSIVYRPIRDLLPYARNAVFHDDAQVAQIVASIEAFGWTNPILIDEDGEIIAGHGRALAAEQINFDPVPTITLAGLTDEQKRAYRIADNRLPRGAGWNDDLLALELADLQGNGFDLSLTGFDAGEINNLLSDPAGLETISHKGNLAGQFMAPPFSVLNARDGWWMDRKRAWLEIGIQSEVGRDGDMIFHQSTATAGMFDAKNRLEQEKGRAVSWDEYWQARPDEKPIHASSIFDPVLCELAYRWFSAAGATVLDPFAGGSVRGIVAGALGRNYYGCDLRPEQVAANIEQGQQLAAYIIVAPRWVCGDSLQIVDHLAGVSADLLFTCPPYADLEVYSDNPADLSRMDYPAFLAAYRQIIARSLSLLRDNRFAVIVVGEVRDKKGMYRNFVGDTVQAFIDAGARFYNEAILVSPLGSLPVRVGAQFTKSRKLGKTHQNVLVFVKGDPVEATKFCGVVDVADSLAQYAEGEE